MKPRTLYLAVLGCLLTPLPAVTAYAAPATVEKPDAVPLTGAAWNAADRAYRAYAAGDYAAALRNVDIALKMRPDLARLHALRGFAEQGLRRRAQPRPSTPTATPFTVDVALLKKLDALETNGDQEVALALAEQGLRAPGRHDALADRARQLRRQAAMQVAAKALRAEEEGDAPAALAAIRSAPAYDPEAPQYRLMLIKLLNENHDAAGAAQQARMALAIDSDDAMLQVYTAYLLQQQGQWAKAQPLYQQALTSDALGDADLRNLRLIGADAALAAGDTAAAIKALAPLPDTDAEVRDRRALARLLADGSTRFRPTLVAPQLHCIVNRFGPVCSLFAGSSPAQRIAADAYREQNAGNLPEALRLVADAIRVAGPTTELAAQRKQVLASMGREQATLAFKAIGANDTTRAAQALQRAIAFAPDVLAYRMMLIDIRVQNKAYADAEQLASEALRMDAGDVAPRVMHGYLRQVQGDLPTARRDYLAALADPDLGDGDRLGATLYVADALAAGGDYATAASVLEKYPSAPIDVQWRRRLVTAGGPPPPLYPPGLDYRTTPYETVVTVKPSPYAADALVAAVFRAMAAHDDDQSLALARMLVASDADNVNYQRVLGAALTEAGATREARQVNARLGTSVPSLDFAYMAQRVKAPQLAAATFREIDQAGELPDRALQDAGYAALAANERRSAGGYFKRAIDAAGDNTLPLDQQQLFDVRRTVEQIEREWGGYASLSYRGASPQSNPAGAAASDSAQLGVEGFWRPPQLNRGNQYLDLYARFSGNVYSREEGIATGVASTLGAVGVRVKPLASQNVVLAAERLVPIGSRTASDWLLRAAYSADTGADLRARAGNWTMAQLYAEGGRYLSAGTTYATAEGQFGRSFLLQDGGHAVFTPYLVLGADYNQGFLRREAIGAGIGLGWRYWYNEDRYTAPRSYFDLTVQYRARISGDDRAGGVVLRAVVTH
jgi:hypothetical protein